jgi:hypothetical protein
VSVAEAGNLPMIEPQRRKEIQYHVLTTLCVSAPLRFIITDVLNDIAYAALNPHVLLFL